MRLWTDTGHMGADSGVVDGKQIEVKRNDKLADAVEALARVQGWTVGSTNEKDYTISLSDRYRAANAFGADVFVSLHHDWDEGTQAVIYPKNHDVTQSRRLADYINRRIDPLAPTAGKIYADRRGLAVLNGTDMPACIIEASRIQDSYDVGKMAEAIIRGICDYRGLPFRASLVAPPALPVVPASPQRPKPPGKTPPMLREGSAGYWVRVLQKKLGHLVVDGDFGPRTRSAVKTYQRSRKLVADGIVGPKTWKALGL
jgi:N-acetylmuramoyl-L-alanine amidase